MSPDSSRRPQRVGVYGGSFDPVHAGHLHLAREAQRTFELDRIVFVPVGRSPFKPRGPIASPEDRVAMLEIATRGEPTWSISRIEIERPGPSFTYDTLRELPGSLGLPDDALLYQLIGWDNLRGLERWYRARDMLALAQPVVVWRGEDDPELLRRLEHELGPELFRKLERGLVRVPPAPESATDLRARLARGEDPGPELPRGVLEYVRAKGIYRSDR